jgi:GrpB-like predicted nucleotidyltransferase (UPF0157 family)
MGERDQFESEASSSTARKPATEEEIQAAWVENAPVLTSRIQIVDHNPNWPQRFEREASRVRAILGDRVLMLEHTGSTSVPGLAAKDIIDMLLIVADSSNEAAYVQDLESAGYLLVIREPDWHEHRVFKGPDTNINLHVLSRGSVEIPRILGFRDWLRAHPEDRDRYQKTKRELAQRDWKYVGNYADAKTEIVEQIIARAIDGVGA